jgi:hypothetical protein
MELIVKTKEMFARFATYVFLTAATMSGANTAWHCEGCNADQITATAESAVMATKPYAAYVVNVKDNVVGKYVYQDNMTSDFNPETDALTVWAMPLPVEAEVFQYVAFIHSKLGSVRNETLLFNPDGYVLPPLPCGNTSCEYVVPYDYPVPQSIWDLVGRPDLQNNLGRWVAEHPDSEIKNAIADVITFLGPIGKFLLNPDALNLQMIVQMQDGSRITMRYDINTGKWRIIPETAEARNGTPIPFTRESMGPSGTEYHFGPDDIGDYDAFLRNAIRFGIPIVNGNGGTGGTVSVGPVLICNEGQVCIFVIY